MPATLPQRVPDIFLFDPTGSSLPAKRANRHSRKMILSENSSATFIYQVEKIVTRQNQK